MARVTLSQAGEDVIVGGADVQVIGTSAGGEVITVVSGNIRLDPSFNAGGDTIVLPGNASDYTAYRAGGEVIFTRNDGGVTLRIPIGSAGTEIQFNGGDSRTLLFDSATGQATLEGQTLGTNAGSPTPLTPSGPAPVVGYDVTNTAASVAEGDSGSRLLVFTIALDRPVTAADGPLTLNYQTQNGTADSATDYVAAAGTVTFVVGQQVATVSIVVNGDVVPEANETVNLLVTGAGLRNGPETLVGTITNDDNAVALTNGADNLQGSAGSDNFFAANAGLGAGDKISDASTTDNDTFSLAVDATTTNRNFGGFALTNIENVEVTNDSLGNVTLDMSSSTGVKSVASVNSSNTVIFNEVTSLANVVVDNVTGAFADVRVYYQAAVTAGTTPAVNVIVNDATVNQVLLGTISGGVQSNTGIEAVNLVVSGTSTINSLNTQLSSLTISGGGDVTIASALSPTIQTINAANAGRVSVNFNGNDFGTGVTFTGSNGNDTVISGQANDTINTGLGDDLVDDEGGNDVINTGGGNDSVVLRGAGNVTIDAGIGNDSVSFAGGTFDGSDKVAFGDGADTLVIAESSVETDYVGITSAETLTVTVQGLTDLGSNGIDGAAGEAAGIRTVNLNVDAAVGTGNDTLNATDYVGGLTVNLGATAGTDTVRLGAGADVINTASLDDADVLVGNGGSDTLNVTDGSVFLSTSSQFTSIETINLVSDGDGEDAFIQLDDSNAPTANGTLTINAGSFTKDEQVQFFGTAITAYSVNLTSGAANDFIDARNTKADTVSAGLGDDVVFAAGGDTVNAGGGVDTIILEGGANVVLAGDGNDTVFIDVGAGNNTISGEAGDDTFFVVSSATLTAGDVIDGGSNVNGDVISVQGTFADAQFTGLSNVEILTARAGAVSNITLATEAEAGGIRTVNLNDGGADVLDASKYSAAANLTVNSAGGNDTILTGAGADVINLAGAGSVTVDTGAGDDRIRVSGTVALDATDKIAGGLGNDVIELDNTNGAVVGTADLTNVTGIDSYRILASGERGSPDADANVLTFTSTNADVVTSVTPINVDASALTDGEDSLTVVIANSVRDGDFTFNITGSSTQTIVDKQNLGINNNINFTGGTGVDTLRIDGGDAGSTVNFNGNGGNDVLFQTGGLLTDDGFIGISSVEVLSGNSGTINAVLGARAAISGITTIAGTAGIDRVTLGAGFNNNLTVNLGGGDDVINGSASAATVSFVAAAADFTGADVLSGGTGTNDSVNITAGGTANLTGVTKVEVINVNNVSIGNEATVIDLNATAASVDGTVLTVNVNGSGAGDTLTFNGGAATENIVINGGAGNDFLNTGSGIDTINGGGGDDTVFAGTGADTINGGAGNDTLRGEAGADTINGDDGNDTLYGGLDADTLNGGIGDDVLFGGLGRDLLSGGAGADNFAYQGRDESRVFPGGIDNRDVISDFVSGTDKIDLRGLTDPLNVSGDTIRFNGNWQTFGEGQGAVSGTGGDGNLDVVYIREANTLWIDTNDDGQLNGEDMQIILTGVQNLVAADVYAGATVNNVILFSAPAEDIAVFRTFENMHFA